MAKHWLRGLWIGAIIGFVYFIIELILELTETTDVLGIINIFLFPINLIFPGQIIARIIGGGLLTILGFALVGALIGLAFKRRGNRN